MAVSEVYEPPRPSRLPPVMALLRTVWHGQGDLLSLLPGSAFAMQAGELGYSRRSIKLFNDPDLVRQILHDQEGIFPKSDLMVGALEPLIGDSMFVSDGAKWRRQRAMIDPAFSKMRLTHAFTAMQQAVDACLERLQLSADRGELVSLDRIMSELTADIICRTVFSTSLASRIAQDVFDDFEVFERGVAQVKIWRLILDPAWTRVPQTEEVLSACKRIRHHLGGLIDTHTGPGAGRFDDIASAVMAARDPADRQPFTREELIDQLGVFFLAGHETTASALTWAFYMLAMCPDVLARLRAETGQAMGGGELPFEAARGLTYTRAVFKETLRLYPPITFLPRVALKATRIGRYKVRKGALLMIAPWTLHRHTRYWREPDRFDPERFLPGRDRDVVPGSYIPFGSGPHTCIGAGFAAVESALILARLTRAFDFVPEGTSNVRPAARLTTRPAEEIKVRIKNRSHGRSTG